MKGPDQHWATSYAMTCDQLYIGFPYWKYISIYREIGGSTENHDLCGRVFRYFMYLAIRDIIENQTMLKFPPGSSAWMEMIAITDDDFIRARLNGAFLDIDFLASGFTGYNITIRFGNRYGKWRKRLYISSLYRDKIVRYTNEGKQLTSTKIRQVKDYVDEVLEVFPILSKSEINKICAFGLKRYAFVNRNHCDVLLQNIINENLTAYCGKLPTDDKAFWNLWYVKWRMKERMIYRLRKKKWDGYYYIGVNLEQHQELLNQRGKTKHFKNIHLVKVLKELHHERGKYHIWRVPYPIDCGWKFWRDILDTDKAEYVEPSKYDTIHKYYKQRAGYGLSSTDTASRDIL